MRVYIQSKSGEFNSVQEVEGRGTLQSVIELLRYRGAYDAEYRDKAVLVPFEEIKFIRKAGDND